MPIITHFVAHDGAEAKAKRLGLNGLLEELRSVIEGFELCVANLKNSNGSGTLRKMIDDRFRLQQGWINAVSGDIDWLKCAASQNMSACLGVEVQVSGRSDLVAVDLIHIMKNLREGTIDVAALIVPDDELGYLLTDRTPRFSDVERHLKNVDAQKHPLFVIAFKHDGFGPALQKQTTRLA